MRYGKASDFRSAIDRIHDAAEKTKWPVNFFWYRLENGGQTGEYVLSIPHKNWADFEDKPDTKPFRDMIKEAFGQLRPIPSSIELTNRWRKKPVILFIPARFELYDRQVRTSK